MKKQFSKFMRMTSSTHLLTGLIGVLIFIICRFFVWTHDDYTITGIVSFQEALYESLFFGNGRFLGNFLVKIVMSRGLLDTIVRTVCIWTIIITSAVLVDDYRKRTLIFLFLLYIGMGTTIFSQVFVWGHGFYNYVPPVTLLILSVCILRSYYVKNKGNTMLLCMVLALTGVSQQLFAENSTTINLLLSLLILAIVNKQKLNIAPALSYSICSVLGAAIMFIGPVAFDVFHDLDDYRGINELTEYIFNALHILKILSASAIIWILLSIILIVFIKQKGLHQKKHFLLAQIYLGVFPVLAVIQNLEMSAQLHACIDLAFVVYLLITGIVTFKVIDKHMIKANAVLILLIVLSMLQLLVVNPIGARCLFITYALLCIFVLSLGKELFAKLNYTTVFRATVVSATACVLIYGLLMFIHVNIWRVNNVRVEYANEQIANGQTEVEIINLPYDRWVHFGNESYAYGYTFNQGNKDEMSFTYIDYEDYLKSHKAE